MPCCLHGEEVTVGWVVIGETLETEGQTEPHGGPQRGAGG